MDKEQQELLHRVAKVISHELRNPLAVMNNSAYFLKAKLGAGADPKVEKHLGILASEIARADGMIAEMLAYSRPVEAKPAEADLVPWIAAELEDLDAEGAKVSAKLPKSLKAAADEAAFRGALRRLLKNAVQAAGAGGSVTVSASSEKGSAVVTVADSGKGIAPEADGRLFTPFFTTKPKGLGLGLAMARRLMEAQGGRAECRSGKNGLFALILPQ
jgi:signal transduction histidine kinase